MSSANYYIQVQYSSPGHFLTAVYFAKYAFANRSWSFQGFMTLNFLWTGFLSCSFSHSMLAKLETAVIEREGLKIYNLVAKFIFRHDKVFCTEGILTHFGTT